jgi:glycosyltransferase involved in cell wall biosynthesis
MYISQCIIVKNEEKNIEHCLTHLKSVVDEQIVVDTGSTDRTIEIAKELGAKVFHFDWIDDFSAARNFALDKAKGDWIIFLDCDEYFSEDSVPLIRECIKKYGQRKKIEGLTTNFINIKSNGEIISTVKNVSARIFKRKSYLRYKNKIHEILVNINKANENIVRARY